MSNDIDLPPVYDPFVKVQNQKDYMSDVYRDWLAAFVQTVASYLTSGGIFLPNLTTAQRDALDDPQEGQVIYNTDATPGPPRTAQIQVWQVKAGVGAWYTFTTT